MSSTADTTLPQSTGPQGSLEEIRAALRAATLEPEQELLPELIRIADLPSDVRARAQSDAAEFVRNARAGAARSSLIDKFLLEYGLSTSEGVTLMRLAEALMRTPDAATADALIKDKVEIGNWRAHVGKSPFPLVNVSTRALMLTAAWLDDVDGKDPLRRVVGATKSMLDRLGDPTIRAAVGQAMRIMGEHFVLGQTIDEALRKSRPYRQRGYLFSYDMLGEAALTAADADKFYADYVRAIKALSSEASSDDVRENPGISVKLSAIHPRYQFVQKHRVMTELVPRVKALALKARSGRLGFNIDAEEADRLDLSLDIIAALVNDPELADWDGFGVVVQAYQRRAPHVIRWLASLARGADRRIMVRLVKGAYWDAEIKRAQVMGLESYPTYTRKVITDVSYLACARLLFQNADVIYPQIATHNALSAELVDELAGDGAEFEFQRLYGMGEALHDRLLAAGERSRIYAPVGGHKELLPYLVRRLLENGANSSFVNQLFDPDLSVDAIVSDPIAAAERLSEAANPEIPSPRDLFRGERLSAIGLDETDPATASRLEEAVIWSADHAGASGPLVAFDIDPTVLKSREIRNPARLNHKLADVREADALLVDRAAKAAAGAAASWARRPSSDRSAALRRAAALLETRYDEFIGLAVNEAGKTIPDAIAEVREAVDFLRYYAARADDLPGEPVGVVACISPWNFPLAIFLGQVAAALATGNVVLAKPAEQTPLIAIRAAELLHEAGIPTAALQLLPGDGPSVGARLVADRRVGGVVFTGSTSVAQAINKTLRARSSEAVLIAETGGINTMIIDSTALLEQAVKDVIASAFQSAGQRCSACRVVLVQKDIADRFAEMLAGAVAELNIGAPELLSVDVGPLIDAEAQSAVSAYIEEMKRHARVIAEAAAPDGLTGHFIRPIAFEVDRIDIVDREVFAPVLHVVRFESSALTSVVERINSLGYGLTMGLHSRIDDAMHQVAARARVGNLYVNRNQIGAVVGVQPFGGEGLSGTGPKAGGPHYLHALRKRNVEPAAETSPAMAAEGSIAMLAQRMELLEAGFEEWRLLVDRHDIFQRAAHAASRDSEDLAAQALSAAAAFIKGVSAPTTLPGPTGEANTLSLRPKGIILCIGGAPGLEVDQVAKALGAGNAVVAPERLAEPIGRALKAVGLQAEIILGLPLAGGAPADLISNPRIAGIAFDGAMADVSHLGVCLADRDGPITPLLSAHDPVWRYGVERTLTINTTAAGGDVRLLSLPS
ncbi:MAG: bifunctional proline dehydrogenase/L-glutamate gamma-semialdehyde dehydrogenase PutA [Alphaproteobacteria bacterium]|nr:bifunctional proline dehydrogenase/L-glutamate gamma-semialdehyde dehydrogenase PutA [Alphaproteobacteria bacterium]